LEREQSLRTEFEAGAVAMRANPFQSFRRSKVIVDELRAERRDTQEWNEMVARRHTIVGHPNEEPTSPQSETSSGFPMARIKKGRMGEQGGQSEELWHRVKTIHGEDVQEGSRQKKSDDQASPSEHTVGSSATGSTAILDDEERRGLITQHAKRQSLGAIFLPHHEPSGNV